MTQERASIFEDDELDLSAFTPKPAHKPKPINKDAIRTVAETRGFKSREPEAQRTAPAPAPQLVPAPQPVLVTRPPRRYVTGRNRQLNLKVTEGAADKFYALADANHWVLGEAFEMAIEALERQMQSSEKARKS